MRIERASGRDFEEMMQFMLRCFRTVNAEHDRFESLYPDLYRPDTSLMRHNFLIREGGRIVSMAGVFPADLVIGPVSLRVAGVGGVCTEPSQRGRGFMSALMVRVCEEILAEGYPLAWLTGERDRYARFGWEKAGTDLVSTILKLEARSPGGWDIMELDSSRRARELFRMQEQLSTRGVCDAHEYARKLQRGELRAWGASRGSREAYVLIDGKYRWLAEWGGDPEGVGVLVRHAFSTVGTLRYRIPPFRDEYTDMLRSMAQQYEGPLENLAVFDVEALFTAFEPYLQECWPQGRSLSLVMGGDYGGSVQVLDGHVVPSVGKQAMMIELDCLNAVSFLFGPAKPSLLLDLTPEERWLDQVFPLPFTMPSLWRV